MPDCDYCEAAFEDEDALLEHMGDAHEGELGRIDQRRVASHRGDGAGLTIPSRALNVAAALAVVVIVAGAVYAAVGIFGGSAPERIHEHGTINMTVEGERLAFSQSQHTANGDFHFHGSGPRWHMHPSDPGRLTLAEALADVGIELTADSVTVGGETYSESDPGTTLTIEVDGSSVDPTEHQLHEDEHVHVVVATGN